LVVGCGTAKRERNEHNTRPYHSWNPSRNSFAINKKTHPANFKVTINCLRILDFRGWLGNSSNSTLISGEIIANTLDLGGSGTIQYLVDTMALVH